jgi:HK97 family phage portal protein
MGLFDKIKKRNITFNMPAFSGGFSFTPAKSNTIALACIDLIGTAIAALPFEVYKRTPAGRQKQTSHPLAEALRLPNVDEPRSLFFYQLVKDYFQSGNIFLYKYSNSAGEIYSLFRLDPAKVKVSRDAENRKVFSVEGKNEPYDYRQVLHIPARFNYDGLVGVSIFDHFRSAFEIAGALDAYLKSTFSNGFGAGKRMLLDLSEVLDSPKLSKEQIEELKAKFLNDYTGYMNAGKPIIKTVKGAKYEPVDIGGSSNREQQMAESVSVAQDLICKVFNVPASLLKGKNEYNGLEALYVVFLDFAVRPVVDALVDGFNSMLRGSEREYLYVEPNYNALMRVDTAAKIEAYVKQLSNGMLSINEQRAMENRPGIGEAGDFVQAPANLIPVTMDVINARLATQKLAIEELHQLDKKKTKSGEY